jgi:hypothetical protein
MAITPKYGSRELVNCLNNLGFSQEPQTATRHVKFKTPQSITINPGQRSFIMVQLGIKTFDSNTCPRYITEIKNFGFSRETIIKNLKK